MKKYECEGCHRHLFSYEDPSKNEGQSFQFECPMCGTMGSIPISKIQYDGFLTDPKLKGVTPEPKEAVAPPPELKPQIDIKVQLDISGGELSPKEQYIMDKILRSALTEFKHICEQGLVDRVYNQLQEIEKKMQSGLSVPGQGIPPGAGSPPPAGSASPDSLWQGPQNR